jgi:hypothetical protein
MMSEPVSVECEDATWDMPVVLLSAGHWPGAEGGE